MAILKKPLLLLFPFVLLASCDQSILARVYYGPELRQQKIPLVDYDFVSADGLHFEFITGAALNPAIEVVFYDEAGNVLVGKTLGEATNAGEESEGKSYLYRIGLEEIKSERLIHRVRIGD